MDDVSFWLVALTVILFFGYAILIERYRKAWMRLPEFTASPQFTPTQKVTVIIPARNEQRFIGACLQSLVNQHYPGELLQVIVVDDHSTDGTAAIVTGFNNESIRLISLQDHLTDPINSYKKKALEIAIQQATGDWIVTTDADCTAGPDWITTLMAFQQETGAVLIAAPVRLQAKDTLLHVFQSLDFLTLQGITGASISNKLHSMGNGANLCYQKKAFYDVNGFQGIDHLASGDDMLLMHKIAQQFPGGIRYLKSRDAVVTSAPAASWPAFWQQRIRWASKADKYDDKKVFRVLLLVYALNVMLLTLFVLCFFYPTLWLVVILFFFSKVLLEYPFVSAVAVFFRDRWLMKYFPFLQPLHIGYTVVAGWLGKFGKYKWKGRSVR